MTAPGSATLSFLQRNGAGLEAVCQRCGETKTVDVGELIVRFGSEATLDDLEPRVRACSRDLNGRLCGGKAELLPTALRHGWVE